MVIEIEVWDGYEYYSTAYGPVEMAVKAALHYAQDLGDSARFIVVERREISQEELLSMLQDIDNG